MATKTLQTASCSRSTPHTGNLLVNADCELKICDFGLARGFEIDPEQASKQAGGGFMTEYVATRWYRAPEIMLSFQNYTTAIDVWSVGCILAELLGGKPIFKGRDYVDQLNQILHYLGTPSEETLRRVGSPRAQEYIRSLPFKPRIPFSTLYPKANPLALDLLDKMLAFDPAERISCEEALLHPYLSVWHDPVDEPLCSKKFDFGFEAVDDVEGMKRLILEEVKSFRSEVRGQSLARERSVRRQDSLPIPSREEIQKSSPIEEHHQQVPQQQAYYTQQQQQQQPHQAYHGSPDAQHQQQVLGASSGLVQQGGMDVAEEPNEALERELGGQ